MPNPFVYDRPLPPAELIDRDAELELLVQLALSGQSARLTGPRRYGKTTLLGRLSEQLRQEEHFSVAIADMSRATSIEDIVQRLGAAYDQAFTGRLRRAWRSLRRRIDASATLGVPGIASTTIRPGRQQPQPLAALHELLEAPSALAERTGTRCLVAYDEFPEMLNAEPELDGVLRSHIQHHGAAVSYVFAGSHTGMMNALFGDRRRPLFEQARAVHVGPLSAPDVADFIETRLRSSEKELGDSAADRVASLTAGHPQRAMMVAHFLWETTSGDSVLDAVDAAWEAALTEATDGLQRLWDSLSANERRFVKAVAGGHEHPLRKSALGAAGLAKSSAVQARDRLAGQGDLLVLGEGRVRLADPFLGAWARGRP